MREFRNQRARAERFEALRKPATPNIERAAFADRVSEKVDGIFHALRASLPSAPWIGEQ